MLETGTILFFAFGYVLLLFAIAWYGDRRADEGASITSNPYIYTLSLAVYCTAWTFYGSVGRAVRSGAGFLTIYIGPTLMAVLGWFLLKKIIRICKVYRITSIADFISSRYGKSPMLAGGVSIVAVLGIIPYIALQLKAIAVSYVLIRQYPSIRIPDHVFDIPVLGDTSFYVAILLSLFAVFFGTRHLEATERHEGLVAAIAFESVVKMAAFLAVGIFVTWGIMDGPADIFSRVNENARLSRMLTLEPPGSGYLDWLVTLFLSMMAIVLLPRQFQVMVVENVNPEHLNKAMWLFPLYLLIINIFVLPIAFTGLLMFPDGSVDADTFVISLPMAVDQQELAMLVFLGGLSAATGMVIVESIALSTMICNDLIMPVLLRIPQFELSRRPDLTRLILSIRRGSIVLILMLGYIYYRIIGGFYPLVSIGIISFAAVTQFAPAVILGIFWKQGTRAGATWGLVAGFSVWCYTLALPTLAQAGFVGHGFMTDGAFGLHWLKPYSLFGMTGMGEVTHGVFWSMVSNMGTYIGVSLFTRPSMIERSQAVLFVDVMILQGGPDGSPVRPGVASVHDLRRLLERFLGRKRTSEAFAAFANGRDINWDIQQDAGSDLVDYMEKLLAGAIGSASAHVLVGSVVKEAPLGLDDVMHMLDETRQFISYSRELEKATAELQAANLRLKELDRLKDEFVSTVTHELRTPLTSIRSLAEIIHDTPDLETDRSKRFSAIIIKESERLTRLITQMLDVQKIESGRMTWKISQMRPNDMVRDALAATRQLIDDKGITLELDVPDGLPNITGDSDRLIQVMVNLIYNAVKFCPENTGWIRIRIRRENDMMRVDVTDNGIGIPAAYHQQIFEKFYQVTDDNRGRPMGSGLGLSITRSIIDFHKGRIWVDSSPGQGATFSFVLPLKLSPDTQNPYGV
ncbi:MAG: sensor histidine kinase [Pseudomonadota bacterium]